MTLCISWISSTSSGHVQFLPAVMHSLQSEPIMLQPQMPMEEYTFSGAMMHSLQSEPIMLQ